MSTDEPNGTMIKLFRYYPYKDENYSVLFKYPVSTAQ